MIGLKERTITEAPLVVTPSVNLLSPWVQEEVRVRRLRQRFGFGLVVLLVLVAGFWSWQRITLSQVEADLRGEEATAESLQRRIADLGPVQAYVDGVDRRTTSVQGQMITDVAFSAVLEQLAVATPPGVRIETLSVDLPTGASVTVAPDGTIVDPKRGLVAAGCPGPDPFAVLEVIGCVTLSGTADDRGAVGALVEGLAANDAFAEPFISTTTTDDGSSVAFSGSVALTPQVFSGRYDERADITGIKAEDSEGSDR